MDLRWPSCGPHTGGRHVLVLELSLPQIRRSRQLRGHSGCPWLISVPVERSSPLPDPPVRFACRRAVLVLCSLRVRRLDDARQGLQVSGGALLMPLWVASYPFQGCTVELIQEAVPLLSVPAGLPLAGRSSPSAKMAESLHYGLLVEGRPCWAWACWLLTVFLQELSGAESWLRYLRSVSVERAVSRVHGKCCLCCLLGCCVCVVVLCSGYQHPVHLAIENSQIV